jgi:hypothetical protein
VPTSMRNHSTRSRAMLAALLAGWGLGAHGPAAHASDAQAPAAHASGLAAPRNLTARALATDRMQLSWSGRPGAGGEFHIEEAPLGGSFGEVAVTTATNAEVSGLAPATAYTFRVRASRGKSDSPYSNQVTAATFGVVAPCVADDHTLCLRGGRFRATSSWLTATGSGAGSVAPWSAGDSGLLWFFQSDNWELLVKVIDGCAVNDHFWVFYAATSDVQFTVSVSDTQSGATQIYFHPLGAPATSLADTNALAVCP